MFDPVNMPDLQRNYAKLNTLYPDFMVFLADKTDRHIWRKRTLRHAAWLLTSEVDFSHAHAGKPVYPGRTFIMWLKWLTWVQTLVPADAVVKINGARVTDVPPAKAITDTLLAAFNDGTHSGVVFFWTEKAAGLMTVTVVQAPGKFSITVESINAAGVGGHSDNEEDQNLP